MDSHIFTAHICIWPRQVQWDVLPNYNGRVRYDMAHLPFKKGLEVHHSVSLCSAEQATTHVVITEEE